MVLEKDADEESFFQKVIFIQFQDSECGVVGWKYEQEYPHICLSSARTFDTFEEAVEEYLESRKSEPS